MTAVAVDRSETLVAEVVRDRSAFEALEPAWWSLWRRSPGATPFQSPAWLIPWWRHFAPGELTAIAVREGGRLVGLAPFYREDGPLGRRLLPIGISVSDYLDVLLDPASEDAPAALVAAGLPLDWQRWEFEELRDDAAAWRLPSPAGVAIDDDAQSVCPTLFLRGGLDLAACVPARRRRQLRRAVAAASRRGSLIIEPAGEEPDAFLDHLVRLHRARWTERGEEGVLADERVEAFQREALPKLAAAGLSRAYLIRIGGVVAAAYYGLFDRGRAYGYLGGFDPDFRAESPGSILIGHAIVAALAEGGGEFHFLRGREEYKYSWGAVDRWNRRRSFRRPA